MGSTEDGCGCRPEPRFWCRRHAIEAGLPLHPGAIGVYLSYSGGWHSELPPAVPAEPRTFHGDPPPPVCCDHCASRKREAADLRTRARLLEESIVADEPRAVVAFHALLMLKAMKERGIA